MTVREEGKKRKHQAKEKKTVKRKKERKNGTKRGLADECKAASATQSKRQSQKRRGEGNE